jgi:hypothetical protein
VKCYSIIFEVLEDLESFEDDSNPAMQRLRSQTYELVYGSDDELFHQALYDWYVSRGQHDRLLEVFTNSLMCLTLDTNSFYPRIFGTSSNGVSIPSESIMAIPCQKRKLP